MTEFSVHETFTLSPLILYATKNVRNMYLKAEKGQRMEKNQWGGSRVHSLGYGRERKLEIIADLQSWILSTVNITLLFNIKYENVDSVLFLRKTFPRTFWTKAYVKYIVCLRFSLSKNIHTYSPCSLQLSCYCPATDAVPFVALLWHWLPYYKSKLIRIRGWQHWTYTTRASLEFFFPYKWWKRNWNMSSITQAYLILRQKGAIFFWK